MDFVVESIGVITVLVSVIAVVGNVLEVWKFQRVPGRASGKARINSQAVLTTGLITC